MYIEQIYTSCLAEAAYYIESGGEAAIIDPIREVTPYLEKAENRGVKIKYVFETHFHADFVSGHIDLSKATGAEIIFGPHAETKYKVYNAKDGELFTIGKLKIKTLHTPGHTPESTCYLLYDEAGREHALFTGDTLFVGDVGRPDLLDGKMTKETLAEMLYDSLNTKIKTLPDEVLVYPAHGPGSSCGKNIGKETWSTIGQQKKMNYALQNMGKKEFVESVTAGLTEPPPYFFKDVLINKEGYDAIDDVVRKNFRSLSIPDFKKELDLGALILDTRDASEFEKGFIKEALNIGLDGSYAIWVGTLIDIARPLVLVCDPGKEKEAIIRLARIGYENVKGFLKDGMTAWLQAGEKVETVHSITAQAFSKRINEKHNIVLDVRKAAEYEKGHVKDAVNITLADLPKELNKLNKDSTYLIHCAGGYRSMIASSLLQAEGFSSVFNVYGGFSEISKTGVDIE